MDCAFCGEEFTGNPVRQDGQIFCSVECAEMAAEVGIDDEDFELGDDGEDDVDMDFEEESEEY